MYTHSNRFKVVFIILFLKFCNLKILKLDFVDKFEMSVFLILKMVMVFLVMVKLEMDLQIVVFI